MLGGGVNDRRLKGHCVRNSRLSQMAYIVGWYHSGIETSVERLPVESDIIGGVWECRRIVRSCLDLCILAFQSLYFIDRLFAPSITASTFPQLCIYLFGDDLLLGIIIQIQRIPECDGVKSHFVAYKVFENA
ncbi:hypothetical protein TNCV_1563281 [Trichonephila clavipes]|nr:hypothetical protein TNCV_1563281 [Trichonephila clavipes]